MTVPSTTSRVSYVGTGLVTVYPYTFRIFANTDLQVIRTDTTGASTTLVLTTDYTVSGVGSYSGGNVTLTTALPTDYTLTIRRAVPLTQNTDLRNQGAFFAEVHEDAFDRLTMQTQRINDDASRGLRLPNEEAGTDLLTLLPPLALRKGALLYFDPTTGAPAVGSPTAAVVSAAMVPVVQAATLADARTAMFTAGTVSNTMLAADAVTTVKILDANVTTAKIADGNVTRAKVANGAVVQVVNTVTGASSTTTTLLPNDDTIPTSSEGFEVMTLAITPLATSDTLLIDATIIAAHSAGSTVITAALFQDAGANAIAAAQAPAPSAGVTTCIRLLHRMAAGTVSPTTFRVRIGSATAGTVTFNGSGGSRLMGGVMSSNITITEIKA